MNKTIFLEAREEAGWKREDICSMLGVAYYTLQAWEIGNRKPPAYCKTLYLYWLKNNPNPNKDEQ